MPPRRTAQARAHALNRPATAPRLALALGLCAGLALLLSPGRPHAESGHGAPAGEKQAAEKPAAEHAPPPSIKPSLRAAAAATAAATPAAAHAAPPASERPTAAAAPRAPASDGHLEDVRQRLQRKVDEVRQQQEARTLTLATRAPAAHRRPAPAAPVAAAHAGPAHWSYGGEGGPQEWAEIKPEFATCKVGTRQSPIDIREGIRVDLDPVKFDYRPSAFNVVDNGHTVQVNVAAGNTITVGSRRFELLQFHFHRPSEERINGRQFEMVAHLVHRDLEGRLAVVAVLMDQGRQHPLVQQVWNNLPLEKNVNEPGSNAIDLTQLLPEDRRYFTYMGSLTTPPCTEGVQWIVLKQPAAVSYEQVAIFSRLYPMNARPIQRVGDRLIKESN